MSVLTILLPNYNQAKLLSETLRSIQDWQNNSPFADAVKFLVSDNSSTDESIEVLRNTHVQNLVWHRQPLNLGFARNFWFLFEQANSPWVSFIGSGEIINATDLDRIVELLPDLPRETVWLQTRVASKTDRKPSQELSKVRSLPFNPSLAGNFIRSGTTPLSHTPLDSARFGPWPHVWLALMNLRGKASSAALTLNLCPFWIDQSDGWWRTEATWRNLIDLYPLIIWGRENLSREFREAFTGALPAKNGRTLLGWIVTARIGSGMAPSPRETLRLAASTLPNIPLWLGVLVACTCPQITLSASLKLLRFLRKRN